MFKKTKNAVSVSVFRCKYAAEAVVLVVTGALKIVSLFWKRMLLITRKFGVVCWKSFRMAKPRFFRVLVIAVKAFSKIAITYIYCWMFLLINL